MFCACSDESRASQEVSRQLRECSEREASVVKLLLLGAGGCGKSTVFKQMKLLHGQRYTQEEIQYWRGAVHRNVLEIFRQIIDYVDEKGASSLGSGAQFQSQSEQTAQMIRDAVYQNWQLPDDPGVVQRLQELWKDPLAVRVFTKHRNEMDINDNAEYFIEHMDRFASPGYEPTEADILRCRVKTVGIVEKMFQMGDSLTLNLVDVGGQRNERRKWIHVFDSVTAVVFVASLSEYDQVAAEDQKTNRLEESLKLYRDTCCGAYFEHKPVIIFLNKSDIFAEKIKRVDIGDFFPDYVPERGRKHDYDSALNFIKTKYEMLNSSKDRQIIFHVTNATDTGQIKVVLETVKTTLLEELLNSGVF